MQHVVVIRGTQLGGYPFVLILVGLLILTPISIWLWPADDARWLISAGVIACADVAAEMIARRTFVKVDGNRIRWSFRAPPDKGEEPVGNLRSVTIYPQGALLEFAAGSRLMVGINDFRNRDTMRVVEALRGLGVRIDDSRGPVESIINVLLGRTSTRH